MNKKIFRHEFKYFINYAAYSILSRKLKIILKSDRHSNQENEYHIRSLYFDDVKNSALFEKQSGILERKKYRIRMYNYKDDIIKLEKKIRVGQYIRKVSAPLSRVEFDNILSGNIDFLKSKNNNLFMEFYVDLTSTGFKPVVIVDYIREAYIYKYGNVRITFDKHLKTGLRRLDALNPNIPVVDVIEEPKMILEVKYDNYLPDFIRNVLQIKNPQRYAISKYVICRKFTKNNKWEDN
jgi:hypothetical protein